MRNLKRALSLALASVMLLGMMVVGSSAAFADADEIVNTEAVEITAGLGLFAGTTDGKFDPKGNVTRAQMATIIVKMLYGSEINADQFKGTDKFSDVANFEGGWAEGYINLCANLGVVGGYGDGTFKPGNSVTTAEAVTMIINALGVDAGKGTWPLTVMAKAEEMKLFAELAVKPGTNVALTRDQLASVVLEGIKYSPADATGYQVAGIPNIVFDKMSDALTAAMAKYPNNANAANYISEVVGEDTLWKTVFEVKEATGIIYKNEATTADYAGITLIGGSEYAIETGLEDIGRYVTVYYKESYTNENEPGLTYCLVDEGTTVVLSENIEAGETNQAKQFRAAFGSKAINTGSAVSFTGYVKDAQANLNVTVNGNAIALNSTLQTAPKGTYVIDENNNLISFVRPGASTVTTVTKVNTTAGKESISLAGVGALKNNADEDVVVEYEGIAQDDIVTYTQAGEIYTLTRTTSVESKLAKISATKVDGTSYDVLTVDGKDYILNTGANDTSLTTNKNALNFNNTYKFYIAANGKIVGWETVSGQADLTNVVYVVDVYEVTSSDSTYGTLSYKVYAQGIDMEGKEVTYLLAVAQNDVNDVDGDSNTGVDVLYAEGYSAITGISNYNPGQPTTGLEGAQAGFYSFEKSNNNKAANLGVMIPTAVAGSYNKTTAPLYQKTTDMIGSSLTGKSTNIKTNDGVAYLTENTKFLVYEGSKTTLATALTVGSITHNFLADAPVLLTRNADGNKIVEVVVINKDPDSVVTGDYIYIADNKVAYTNDMGKVYEAYNAKGEVIEIVVDKNATVGTGFYQFATDAEGVTDLTDISGAADVKLNQKFDTVFNNELVTGNIDHYDLTNAIIIDARDEDLIEGSEVYKIETIADMMSLKSIDDAEIYMDIYVDSADETVSIIFITKVVALYTPDDAEQLTFVKAADVDGDIIVWATKNDANGEEVKIEVDMTLVEAQALSGTITYDAANNEF